jgi:hypothetical protein
MSKPKIDLYFNGDYLCSTNQSKTCKAAVAAYLERIKDEKRQYYPAIDKRIAKYPKLLKARFDHE